MKTVKQNKHTENDGRVELSIKTALVAKNELKKIYIYL
jgi:hypothetical protein